MAVARQAKGLVNVPTTLMDELKVNVFMRCFDSDVQSLTYTQGAVACMTCLMECRKQGADPMIEMAKSQGY
jgi:hypothetical protein